MQFVWGFCGIACLLFIGFLLSEHKRHIRWHLILSALLVQLLFGFIVLKWETGRYVLNAVSNGVSHVIGYAKSGASFLFGSALLENGFIVAFQVLPVIIFFSSLMSILYHLRIMQLIIKLIGGSLSKLIGTSKTESFSATANIFVGYVEAPLVIKPYLERMTRSEMFTVMTGGMASVSGSVLAGYAIMGIPLNYLIAASFMSAPASLLISKLLLPETEKKELLNKVEIHDEEKSSNVIDAAAKGAMDGLQIALAVGATLIAFVGLIALLNGLLGSIGDCFGYPDFSLQNILGLIFAPIAFLIGVPWTDVSVVGGLLGQKIAINEFVAFSEIADIKKLNLLTDKSLMITSFALCGFANLGSLAAQLSGFSSIAPKQRPNVAKLGFRAMLAGTIANLLSAAIAGIFY